MYIVRRWPPGPNDMLYGHLLLILETKANANHAQPPYYSSFIAPAEDHGEVWEGWIQIIPKSLLLSREITSGDEKLYFPVHPPCLELFGLHTKGRQTSHRDFLGFDRDALWLAFYLFMERHRAGLTSPYGLAYISQHHLWQPMRGSELLVANPKLDCAHIQGGGLLLPFGYRGWGRTLKGRRRILGWMGICLLDKQVMALSHRLS
jgi:hypothetical protein